MSGAVFMEETKHRNYVMVAAVVVPGDWAALLSMLRRTVRGLVLPGERRVPMTKRERTPPAADRRHHRAERSHRGGLRRRRRLAE